MAKTSSSSFLPSMPVPLCQLQSSAGTGVVTMTPSSLVCAVTFSATVPVVSTTLFVPSVDVTSVEPSLIRCRVDFPWEKTKMLAAFEELWVSGQSLLQCLGPSSPPQPPLMTPPVDVPAPVAVSVASAAASLALSGSSTLSPASSQLHEWSWSCRSPVPRSVPVQSHSAPAPAARGSWSCSWSRRLSRTGSHSRAPSDTRSRSRAPSSTRFHSQALSATLLASSAHLRSTRSSFERSRVSSRCSLSSWWSRDCFLSCSRVRCLPGCRLPSRVFCLLLWSLVHLWTLVTASYFSRTLYCGSSPSVASFHILPVPISVLLC